MRPTKRQKQKEDTRKRIIESAYKVYAEQGFSAASADIAEAAGVAHGTVFAHFSSLDNLLVCVLEDFGEKLGRRLHELSKGSGSIGELLRAHLDALEEHEQFYTRLISESRLLPEGVRNTFISVQSAVAFHLSLIIERERLLGNVKEFPDHIIFNIWVGLIHYYLQNGDIFAPRSSVIRRCGDELVDSFVKIVKN